MAFTRDWDEANPTDSTVANQIDEYNRYLRVDLSDRLKNMVYGLIAGENSLSQHFQYVQFYEQASVSQPSAGYGRLYCKAVGGKCEMYWQDEDGDEIQLTNGGNFGGCNLELVANKDLIGSSTSDITINTNKFTVAGATGNTVIAGTVAQGGSITLGANADLIGSSTSDITFNTDKFTVAGATGNTAIGGTLTVTGAVTKSNFLGAYTNQDDDSNAMLKAHAYKANQDGIVTAIMTASAAGNVLAGYIDETTNPAGAGENIQSITGSSNGYQYSISFPVASGKYFEITDSSSNATSIYWHPVGTLIKPTDQD